MKPVASSRGLRPVGDGRSQRGFQNVEPGEGGEQDNTAGGGGDTASTYDPSLDSSSSERGATTGSETLNLEVALLSIGAVDLIAAEVARVVAQVVADAGLPGVALLAPDTLAALRLHGALLAEVAALEARVAAVAGASSNGDGAAFTGVDAAAVWDGAKQAVGVASAALASLAVSTHYSGRKDTARRVALDAALAKHLGGLGVAVRVPLYAASTPKAGGLVARALALQARCRRMIAAGEGGEDVVVAGDAVGAIVGALFGSGGDSATTSGPRVAERLMVAESAAAALADEYAALSVELTASGGSYRVRRGLLSFLTGNDGLTYNGGAAATFFLFGADGQSALASDTIYFATPHGRFDDPPARLRPTNIGGAAGGLLLQRR